LNSYSLNNGGEKSFWPGLGTFLVNVHCEF
jgi:hypothetical protein